MRLVILIAALLLVWSVAPNKLAGANPAPAIEVAKIRTVRFCIREHLDADTPMCIEARSVRMHVGAVESYVDRGFARLAPSEVLPTTLYHPTQLQIVYVAVVCQLMPERGFREPETLDERARHCLVYFGKK